jgi:hypothetical protein
MMVVVRPTRIVCVALLCGVMALPGCAADKRTAELFGYRPGPDSNQITVVYGQGPADEPGDAEILEQDPSQVKVRVRYVFSDELQNSILLRKETVVTLTIPLGGRKVLNESGDEIPQLNQATKPN